MLRKIWPRSPSYPLWSRISGQCNVYKTPLGLKHFYTTHETLDQTQPSDFTATADLKEVETVSDLDQDSSKISYVFDSNLNYWKKYEKTKENNPEIIDHQVYVMTAMYAQRKSRQYSILVDRLQTLLRDVSVRMQQQKELESTFLLLCNMLMFSYIRNGQLKSARAVFDGLCHTTIWVEHEETHITSICTLMNGARLLGKKSDIRQIMNKLIEKDLMPHSHRPYTTAIHALRLHGDRKGCEYYFRLMKQQKVELQDEPYRAMAHLYSDLKDQEAIIKLVEDMEACNMAPSGPVYSMALETIDGKKYPKEKERYYQTLLQLDDFVNIKLFKSMGMDPVEGLNKVVELNKEPNTRDYNAALSYLLKTGQVEESIKMYGTMLKKKATLDCFTYAILMDAFNKSDTRSVQDVYDLYDDMLRQKIEPDNVIYTSLLSACAKEKNLNRAIVLLKQMSNFHLKPNTINWNAFLGVLAVAEERKIRIKEIKDIWNQMRRWGIPVDTRSYNIYLSVCSDKMAMLQSQVPDDEEPEEDEFALPKRGPCRYMVSSYREMKEYNHPAAQPDHATYTILIKTLASSRYVRLALQILNDSKITNTVLDVSAYNELMLGLQKEGKMSDVMSIWYDMKIEKVLPDNKSYEIVLEACESLGLNDSLMAIRNQRKMEFNRLRSLSLEKTPKPKNARSKRFLKNREAKVVENPKNSLIIKGSTTSQIVNDALKDLYALKRPNAVYFSKKNEIKPFEDESKLEFFSTKNDCAFLVVGTHSKKRPHNLTFVRLFNHQLLDMYELGIENSKWMGSIPGAKCSLGLKPLMIFNGEKFDTDETYKNLKNYFLDFFNGEQTSHLNLAGIEHAISVTATPEGRILFRTYTVQLKKSGVKTPRVELEEMGPHYDFVVRRTTLPKADMWSAAAKVPKELSTKKAKNIEKDEMGDTYGRIHLGAQDLNKIQTRKMKGLKRKAEDDEEEEASKK
ncbi:Brix domain-containing protein [Sporodiniella umbellata]|nr:Brix domain-containing protein [Sporodiniella umbellata]